MTDMDERIPGDQVISQVNGLEGAVNAALAHDRADWGAIWTSIRSIRAAFRSAWFASGQERREVWARFEFIVGRVNQQRENSLERRKMFHQRRENSRELAERIVRIAEAAWPHEDGFIEILGMITGARIFAEVVVALVELSVQVMTLGMLRPPRQDSQLEFLKACSQYMQQAWSMYHESHGAFLTEDHRAIREVLLRVQEELNGEWRKFKSQPAHTLSERIDQKLELIERAKMLSAHDSTSAAERSKELRARWKTIGYVGDRGREKDLWDDFNSSLQAFWEERKSSYREGLERALQATRDNVEKLYGSVEHDREVLRDKEEKLANVFDGRRAEEIREHLQEVIDGLEEKISRKERWIEVQEERIEEMERKLSE